MQFVFEFVRYFFSLQNKVGKVPIQYSIHILKRFIFYNSAS